MGTLGTEFRIHAEQVPEIIKGRLIRYCTSIGYQQESSRADEIVFQRGSVLKGLFSFSPKSLQTVVKARIVPAPDGYSDVIVSYKVNTAAHIITEREVDFWNTELYALKEAVASGIFQLVDVQKAEQTAIRHNWRLLIKMLLTVPLGLLASGLIIGPAVLVARPVMRVLIRLLPIIGANGVSLVSGLLTLAALATSLFLLPQLKDKLASQLKKPGWTSELILSVAFLPLEGFCFGLLMTGIITITELKTDKPYLFLVCTLVGILVIGFIYDRRYRKARKPATTRDN